MDPDTRSRHAEEDAGSVLCDFVDQWSADARDGGVRPLSDYLARFPGHEELVAREFLRLAERRAPHAPDARPGPVPGSRAGADPAARSFEAWVVALRAPRTPAERYERGAELARGGMGAVFRARDPDLRRHVAMKVALGDGRRRNARLLEEAQVTGQLEHPGIVPVHEIGVDGDERVFFTMRLVDGRDLGEVVELVRCGEDGWNLPRALGVLLKVCETVAFAHSRGVVHRDLKPANVMVGAFGEVYVMDWGLALVRGGEGGPEFRDDGAPRVRTDRQDAREELHGSPWFTRDGDVVGTPAYMAPEQAAGRVDDLDPRTDVYAAGALLYHVLAGSAPYADEEAAAPGRELLARVQAGPPRALQSLRRGLPPELVAICEKAMARAASERYPDMRAMAADLRAFLELRVVRAYRTGALAELRKWVARNRTLAVLATASVLLVVSALVAIALVQVESRAHFELLADSRGPAVLVATAPELLPDDPGSVRAIERWLADAEGIVVRHGEFVRELAELRARALPWDPGAPREERVRRERAEYVHGNEDLLVYYRGQLAEMQRTGGRSEEGFDEGTVRGKLASIEGNIARTHALPAEQLTWSFASDEDRVHHDALETLLADLQPMLDTPERSGLVTRLRQRLEIARSLERALEDDEARAWEQALRSIANVKECPAYAGLELRRQRGLVPLRRDARSGLWEFLHAPSGAPPRERADGTWHLAPETGIVLVLVPGGQFRIGAQSRDPSRPDYDPEADENEDARVDGPHDPRLRSLGPYFLSKYEMTQAQWRRCAGAAPSSYAPNTHADLVVDESSPVESVDWETAMQVMRETALTLPTESQWEFAARAGTTTPWWTGSERESLRGAANLADASAAGFAQARDVRDWPGLDDGWPVHAQVGRFRPNPLGLHDTAGNVWEWCRDTRSPDYQVEVRIRTGERTGYGDGTRTRRGGGFASRATQLRSTARTHSAPDYRGADTGLRPAREIER